MKTFLTLWLIVLIALPESAPGEEPDEASPVFQDGEVLQYKVKWTLFRLGTLTFRTFRDSTCRGLHDYKVALYAESNPDIGIIWLRGYFESTMDAASLTSKGVWVLERDREKFIETRATLDEETRRLGYLILDKNTGDTIVEDTLENVISCCQCPSLLSFARSVSDRTGLYRVPTFVDRTMATTEVIFRGEKEEIEIDALESPVRTRMFSGETKWGEGKGVAGFSGHFSGWFTDDDAAVPVRAEMKVIVGSVVVELEKWDRPGWVPPTVSDATASN